MVIGLRFSFQIEVGSSFNDLVRLQDQLITLHDAVKRRRVAAALDFVDQHGGESPTAVSAYHVIAVLIVAFAGRPADIAGIKRGPNNAVGAFQDKISTS
jgi:hypothetical protein